MFNRLGAAVSRHWVLVLLFWVALVAGVYLWAPRLEDVTHDGDFAYLPDRMTSVRGQRLLEAAFPDSFFKSKLVLVVARSDGPLENPDFELADRLVRHFTPAEGEDSPIVDVRSHQSPVIGKRLINRPGPGGQALLIALMLRNEFMAIDNIGLIASIERSLDLVRLDEALRQILQEQTVAMETVRGSLHRTETAERTTLVNQLRGRQVDVRESLGTLARWFDGTGSRERESIEQALDKLARILHKLASGDAPVAVRQCDHLKEGRAEGEFARAARELIATQQRIVDVLGGLRDAAGGLLETIKTHPVKKPGLDDLPQREDAWKDLVALNGRLDALAPCAETSQRAPGCASPPHQPSDGYPHGLQIGVTGSAAVGADMLLSAGQSIRNTERTTVLLVIVILLLVYRAPGLVIVPLATIAVSVWVATGLVAGLTQVSGWFDWCDFKVFKTTKIFIVVILFGAGTDYCLFLISRYKEELQRGLSRAEAIAVALGRVGDALGASALTTIFGLGMMFFADFGKFSNSGPAIALCLVVALAASVTLAPALLRAGGRIVFWPLGIGMPGDENGGAKPVAAVSSSGNDGPSDGPPGSSPFGPFWWWLSRQVIARPGLIILVSVLLMAPLVWEGISVPITYDLLGELQADRPSVRGTLLLRRHFPTSQVDPITVLAHGKTARFNTSRGRRKIALLTKDLYLPEYVGPNDPQANPIRSVRSLSEPLGNPPGSFNPLSGSVWDKYMVLKNPKTKATYVSQVPEYAGNVARFDVISRYNPFSHEAIDLLDHVQRRLTALAERPGSGWEGTEFDFVGTTAGIRDLKAVTDSDRKLIQRLVVIAVLVVLVLILRRPLVCVYLILSVLLSYFVTIGAAEMFFRWRYGETFHGLDWKVPIFLFVILIAVGQDYNIYLCTRVFEEQRRRGALDGLQVALVRTGGIITSCGIIMAGTFASMATGTLRAMHELGFALSLGVLLDTFVIRTILVPAFLALAAKKVSGTISRREPFACETASPKKGS